MSRKRFDLRMTDKVVAITGASSGIGAALSERLAAQGYRVALIARRAGALEAVAARCGGRALVIPADVTRRDDVRRAVATISPSTCRDRNDSICERSRSGSLSVLTIHAL